MDGWKIDEEVRCRKCDNIGYVFYRLVEYSDGAYTDEEYKCDACGHTWWVEGSDY